MKLSRLTFYVASLLFPLSAQADMVPERGAATECNPKMMTFEISSVVGDVTPVKPGHTKLASDDDHRIECRLGKDRVTASIRTIPPHYRGMCMAAGFVRINRLSVNEKPIIRRKNFNWICSGNRVLIGVKISAHESDLLMEKCTATGWDWGKGFTGVECVSEKHSR